MNDKNGYCDSENGVHDVAHAATADCTDWQSINEIENHVVNCTDTGCDCKR